VIESDHVSLSADNSGRKCSIRFALIDCHHLSRARLTWHNEQETYEGDEENNAAK
jgi:hypothetical protein